MDSLALSHEIRKKAIEMTNASNASHIGCILSIADIVAVLYKDIMHYDPLNPKWDNRDRFILSKGHAGAAVYIALAQCKFFDKQILNTYCENGSFLSGHVSHINVPGVEFSTGSLGHGICVASGMAMAAKTDKKNHRVFTIIGDGECNEGSVWEAAMFAAHYELSNLTVIVDHNKLQAMGYCEQTMKLINISKKWEAFGWKTIEVNGHNINELKKALNEKDTCKPTCIIAHTVKGKGISFMEDSLQWHYKSPQNDDYINALKELGESV